MSHKTGTRFDFHKEYFWWKIEVLLISLVLEETDKKITNFA
jgi:hypothetical protein